MIDRVFLNTAKEKIHKICDDLERKKTVDLKCIYIYFEALKKDITLEFFSSDIRVLRRDIELLSDHIPPQEIQGTLRKMAALFDKIFCMDMLPVEVLGAHRQKLFDLVWPIIAKLKTKDKRIWAQLIRLVHEVPVRSQQAIATFGAKMAQDLPYPEGILRLLCYVCQLPPPTQPQAISIFSKWDFSSLRDAEKLLDRMLLTPLEDRLQIVESLAVLSIGLKEAEEILHVLGTLEKIDGAARNTILEEGSSLLECVGSGSNRALLIQLLKGLPRALISSVLRNCSKFCSILPRREKIYSLIHEIIELSHTPYAYLCEEAWPLCSRLFSAQDRVEVIKILKQMPPQEGCELTYQILPYFEKTSVSSRMTLFRYVANIIKEEREEMLALAEGICNHTWSGEKKVKILKVFSFFSPLQWKGLARKLRQNLSEMNFAFNEYSLLFSVLSKSPFLIEHCHEYLINKLYRLNDGIEVRKLTHIIYNHQKNFFAHEQSRLYEEIVRFKTIVDDLHHPANPYVVFLKHTDSARETLNVEAMVQEVLGKSVSLHLGAMNSRRVVFVPRETVLQHCGGHFFTWSNLQQWLEEIGNRLASLSERDKLQVLTHIQQTCLSSLDTLIQNLKDSYFKQLLDVAGLHQISIPCAMFMGIMKSIADKSHEKRAEELLSPREDVLLKMSASIRECSIGKSEGIVMAYNLLEDRYKYVNLIDVQDLPLVARAKSFLHNWVQKKMSVFLSSDTPFLKQVTGEDHEICQLAHQCLYCKNLLAPHLGMSHAIQLDHHTDLLYTALLQKEVGNILTEFTAHFSIANLVNDLIHFFTLEAEKINLYGLFSALIGEDLSLEKSFAIEIEPPFAVSLQPVAALLLLQKADIILVH